MLVRRLVREGFLRRTAAGRLRPLVEQVRWVGSPSSRVTSTSYSARRAATATSQPSPVRATAADAHVEDAEQSGLLPYRALGRLRGKRVARAPAVVRQVHPSVERRLDHRQRLRRIHPAVVDALRQGHELPAKRSPPTCDDCQTHSSSTSSRTAS